MNSWKTANPLFPAYAGVILCGDAVHINSGSFPRIRGGDPVKIVPGLEQSGLFPAYAGVILKLAVLMA